MTKSKKQKELDEELLRECQGYTRRDNKPDGAYIKEGEYFFNINKIKRLISAGADVNVKDEDGWSPLHCTNSVEVAELLIKAGADVNSKNSDGQSPLHWAKSVEVAKLLIKAGADVDSKDNNWGYSPLAWAVDRKNIALVEYLISAGAKVNAKDRYGQSLLSLMLSDKNLEIAKLLIKAGITE